MVTGTCLEILTLAGRRGDVKLATDVFRVLSERDTVFDVHTYEGLLEAYITAQDLNSAFSVAIIMHESGLKVSADGIGPIYSFLIQSPSRPMEAFAMLQKFESSGRKVPVAAVNVCLQACIHLYRLEEAIEIYKALHMVCKSRPDTQTFNILFQGCHKDARRELAMFLASEMTQLGIKPDRVTYDRLVLVCIRAGDLNDAMLYYEEMRNQGWTMRRRTFEVVIDHGTEEGDPRTPAVLKEMYEAGFTPKNDMVRNVKARFKDPPASSPVDSKEEGHIENPVRNDLIGSGDGLVDPIQDVLPDSKEKTADPTQDAVTGMGEKRTEPTMNKGSGEDHKAEAVGQDEVVAVQEVQVGSAFQAQTSQSSMGRL